LVVSLAVASLAAKADRAGGGGDLQPASPAEIRKAFVDIWDDENFGPAKPGSIRDAFASLLFHTKEISDPMVQKVLHKMFGSPKRGNIYSPVFLVLDRLEIQVKENEPCYYKGQPKAEAVVSNNIGDISTLDWEDKRVISSPSYTRKATVCLSVEKFKGIPKNSLHDILQALAAHEVTHIFGYGELEARKIEKFFLANKDLLSFDFVTSRASEDAYRLEQSVANLVMLTGQKVSDLALCTKLGELVSISDDVWESVLDATSSERPHARPFVIGSEGTESAGKLHVASLALLSYCGISAQANPYSMSRWGSLFPQIGLQDRKELSVRLNQMLPEIKVLKKYVGSDSDYN